MGYFERKELKYYIPKEIMEPLREYILQYMQYDPFCRTMAEKTYNVRSIYLDTQRYLFFYEKMDGLKVRKKLRIRAYNLPQGEDTKVFFEIKRKISDVIYKERALVPYSETKKLSNGAKIQIDEKHKFTEKAALNKFIYLTKSLSLTPSTLITYEREAFQGIDDPDVRITFDLNVRSYLNPDYNDIFRESDLKVLDTPYFILEVKFSGNMPFWVRQMLSDFRLSSQSISKYCNSIQELIPSLTCESVDK